METRTKDMATRYVNGTLGTDSGNGDATGAGAWATITYAYDNATDGDTVIVEQATGSYTLGNFLTIDRDVSLTIQAESGADISITKNEANGNIGMIWIPDATDYAQKITFDGFTFVPYSDDNQFARFEGDIHLEFINCAMDHSGANLSSGTFDVVSDDGSGNGNRHLTLDGCTFTSQASKPIVAMYCDTGTDVTINNCTFSHAGGSSIISLGTFSGQSKKAGDIAFTNNTVSVTGNTTTAAVFVFEDAAGGGNTMYDAASKVVTGNTVTIGSTSGSTSLRMFGGFQLRGACDSVTVQDNTIRRTETNSTAVSVAMLEVGVDDSADEITYSIDKIDISNNDFRDLGTRGGHGVVLSRGTGGAGAHVYGNTLIGGDVGFNFEIASEVSCHHNKVYAGRPLLWKGCTSTDVYNNTFIGVVVDSGTFGVIRWDAEVDYTGGTTIDPAENRLHDNIIANDDDSPLSLALYELGGPFDLVTYRNVYTAGANNLANFSGTTADSISEMVTVWEGRDRPANEDNSLLLASNPVEDPANGNFAVKRSARSSMLAANIKDAGAVPYKMPKGPVILSGFKPE
jgi:hypothetical protein